MAKPVRTRPLANDAMPIELAAALKKSPKARAVYDAQAPSHKRAWQRWVDQAKQAATRQRRAAKAAELLANESAHPRMASRKSRS